MTVGSRLWCWIVRAYALLCIAGVVAVLAFHAVYPQYEGVPRWLFYLLHIPASGIEIVPVILLIDVVLAVRGVYRKRTFAVEATLLVIAMGFCLQGLRQSPPPPPKFGITVRGAREETNGPTIARLLHP